MPYSGLLRYLHLHTHRKTDRQTHTHIKKKTDSWGNSYICVHTYITITRKRLWFWEWHRMSCNQDRRDGNDQKYMHADTHHGSYDEIKTNFWSWLGRHVHMCLLGTDASCRKATLFLVDLRKGLSFYFYVGFGNRTQLATLVQQIHLCTMTSPWSWKLIVNHLSSANGLKTKQVKFWIFLPKYFLSLTFALSIKKISQQHLNDLC